MYRPSQALTFNNAGVELDAGLRAISNGQTQIDLAELTVADSAAVATMLVWQRAARKAGKALVFANLRPNLQSLVELYGVAALLRIDTPADGRSRLPSHH